MKSGSFMRSLALKLPVYIVVFCAVLSGAIGFIGYREFTGLSEGEYTKFSNQFAYTALSLIDADRLAEYARSGVADEEWAATNEKLRNLANVGYLASISVTIPEAGSYGARTYVFDAINETLLDDVPRPLGFVESLADKGEDFFKMLVLIMELDIPHAEYHDDAVLGGHIVSSIPVHDSRDRCVAMLEVVKPMSEVLFLHQRYLRSVAVAAVVCTLAFVLMSVVMILVRIVRPLRLITFETSHFAEHGGALTGEIKKIKNKDELGILAKSVEKMSVDMTDYITQLTQMTAEKERLSAELDVATQIQADMLPRIFPPYADLPEVELFATMTPAKEVGGDFYDFFRVDKDHFAVVVGDVSGKGVPAALFMVIAKTLLKNAGLHGTSIAEMFNTVNDQLCEGNDAGLFVTCWMGVLNVRTGELRFANAAHTLPVLYHAGGFAYLSTKPNLMLAGMEGMRYVEHTVTLHKGDRLFIYTDGVTEATNAENALYGEERLLSVMKKTAGLSSEDCLRVVREDVDAFVKDAPQFDDITMLELFYKESV